MNGDAGVERIVTAWVVTPVDEVAGLSELQVEFSDNEDDDDDDFGSGPVDAGRVAGKSIFVVWALDFEHRVAMLVIVLSEEPFVALSLWNYDLNDVLLEDSVGHFAALG